MRTFQICLWIFLALVACGTQAQAQAPARPDRPLFLNPKVTYVGQYKLKDPMVVDRVYLNIKNHGWPMLHEREYQNVRSRDSEFDAVYLSAGYYLIQEDRRNRSGGWATGDRWRSDWDVGSDGHYYSGRLTLSADYVRNGVTLFTATSGEVAMTSSEAATYWRSRYAGEDSGGYTETNTRRRGTLELFERALVNEASYRLMVNMLAHAREKFGYTAPAIAPVYHPTEPGPSPVELVPAKDDSLVWSDPVGVPASDYARLQRGVQFYRRPWGDRSRKPEPLAVRFETASDGSPSVRFGTKPGRPAFHPQRDELLRPKE